MMITIKKLCSGIALLSAAVTCSATTITDNKTINPTSTTIELMQSTIHAKYPGNFMNDFLKHFQKKFGDTTLQETELEFRLSFTVTASGEVDNVIVSTIDNQQLTTDIINIVKGMKKWQPAKENGTKVPSRFAVPFYINISEMQSGKKDIRYTATKADSFFVPAAYPTGFDGFWKEYQTKVGPLNNANFVSDSLKYTYTLTIDSYGNVVGVELKGIENERLKDKFVEDFTKVVTSMKKWIPGSYEGKPVRSRIILPIVSRVVSYDDEY
ncbi:MAG: energy transducer TonB [Flavobacteriaceae bacterium]|jgi:hypothetical protein|nr:energy transducer TonB [Flavobacteriaceae bacterium]